MRQIVLDTETTGLSTQDGHRLTEIGCVELVNRKVTGNTFQTYLNPERDLDEGAARITGLSLEFLQDKPKFPEIIAELFAFIDGADELIIHNASFDIGFLNYELNLMQHACSAIERKIKIFDTLGLARQLHPGQRNNLDALCKRYKIDNSQRNYHGALLDAEILAAVYLAMTAGQTDLKFTNFAENDSFQNQRNNNSKQSISFDQPLKIVLATTEELLEHGKYLEHIKATSAGLCVWEEHE